MPILDIQRQMRELGRIRTGTSRPGSGGRKLPTRLETFRLTSPTRSLIEAAAEVYGGDVVPWEQDWEVITATASLDIVVPPGTSVSSWYEMWAAGGCVRRCDSRTNVLTMGPCLCPADAAERAEAAQRGEACKATTRLNVMLPALPDLGVWRLESHGYYAASELLGAAEVLAAATAAGRLIPARLRLEQRERKQAGKPTKHYSVPVIEFVGTTLAELVPGGMAAQVSRLEPGERVVPQLPATTLPPTSDLRGPDAEGLTADELAEGLGALGIPLQEARLLANETYGPGPLTPAQRKDLLDRLQRRGSR